MVQDRKIGIDIGGVLGPQLKERAQADGTISLEPGPQPGAQNGISALIEALGGEKIFIVSRASSSAKVAANWQWLWHWFLKFIPDLPATNIVIFDAPRSEKGKIVERLGLTTMVDDRYEVLVDMPEGVELIVYCPVPEERERFSDKLNGRAVKEVFSWEELVNYLLDK